MVLIKLVYWLANKLWSTLCNPNDCSLPGSSVHGISQARILEWVNISSSRGIFLTKGSNLGLLLGRQILYHWATSLADYNQWSPKRVGQELATKQQQQNVVSVKLTKMTSKFPFYFNNLKMLVTCPKTE